MTMARRGLSFTTEAATGLYRTGQFGNTSLVSPPEPPKASLEDISTGRELAKREAKPDLRDALEVANLDADMYRAQIDSLRSRTSMREGYETKVYRYLVGYSICAFGTLIASGLGYMALPENVLLAIAGSTALSAIGLVAQIGKGLFGDGGKL